MKTLFVAATLMSCATSVQAQDPFELHVYEYETLPPRVWTLEMHINYIASGTRFADGLVAPTHDQSHVTYELTRGLTSELAIGMMLLTAHRPGSWGMEFGGWRVLPHVKAPERWGLPVDLGLVLEISFQNQKFEDNTRQIEVRPIIQKNTGPYQIDFNPVFVRGVRGQGRAQGWSFEPNLRLGYHLCRRFDPSLEYYGTVGAIHRLPPLREQVHQLYPGGDWKLTENLLFNFGVGFAMTPAGNRLVFKSRFEYQWNWR